MQFSKQEIVKYIKQRHQNDGGFHFANIEPSGGSDTFYAVSVLSMLGETINDKEEIKKFFDALMQDDEINDVIGMFFTVHTLYQLGYKTSLLNKYIDTEEIIRSYTITSRKDIFVESVSSLKNSYYATCITKLLEIKNENKKILEFVRSCKNDDGGYESRDYSSIPDTFFALSTLSNIDELNNEAITKKYLLSLSDSILKSYLEYVYWHFESLLLLGSNPAYIEAIPNYLARCSRTNGGFCRSPFQGISTFEDTFYAVSILTRLERLLNKKLVV
jgi:hypothetical protein